MFDRLFLLIKSNLSFNKNKRKQIRKQLFQEYVNKKLNQTKWGVSYSVFNGFELLESSILSIRDSVDYVNVVYQTKSWYGDDADPELLPTLNKLKDKGLIDELILYTGSSEIDKRNVGLKAARKAGVNYFMTLDCDEFFIKEEVEKAKKEIIRHRFTHTFVPVVNYHIKPEYRSLKPNICIPFFSKLYWFSKIVKPGRIYPCVIDPTRPLNIFVIKFFDIQLFRFDRTIVFTFFYMHHMTTVRKDLCGKFKNYPNLYKEFKVDKNNLKVDELCFNDYVISDLKKIISTIEDKEPIKYDIIKVKNIFNIKF